MLPFGDPAGTLGSVTFKLVLATTGLGGLLWLAHGSWLPDAPAAVSLPAAEVMAVSSPGQAQVVAARMRAGYFLDHLLLPGAQDLGNIALSDLDPGLRAELERGGGPVRVPRPGGGWLVAQLAAGG